MELFPLPGREVFDFGLITETPTPTLEATAPACFAQTGSGYAR
jgi:hypothetical protein